MYHPVSTIIIHVFLRFIIIPSVWEECIHSGNTAKFAKNKKEPLIKTVESLICNNLGLAANG
jgi:hypothetical protein